MPNDVAAEQVKELVGCLPRHADAPLCVEDLGYDPMRLQLRFEGNRA